MGVKSKITIIYLIILAEARRSSTHAQTIEHVKFLPEFNKVSVQSSRLVLLIDAFFLLKSCTDPRQMQVLFLK